MTWIIEKRLGRNPDSKNPREDIRVVTGQRHTEDGLETEVRSVSIVAGDDLAGYDPEHDADIHEYRKAENQYWKQV